MRIQIHDEGKCAWCEVDGTFLYGKNAEELRKTLDEYFDTTSIVVKQMLPKTEAK